MFDKGFENVVYNCDCIELMKEMEKQGIVADWLITDPPYGIGEDGKKNHSRGKLAKAKEYSIKDWDKERISKEYFDLMRKVSKNQIIFGGNYYTDFLPPSPCWIIWDKLNGDNDFADCEMAWCSLNKSIRKFEYRWAGMLQGDMKNKEIRIHPTQKPLPLLTWILNKYTKDGDLILDPFMGSFTTAVACHKTHRRYIGAELDKEYYNKGQERLNKVKSQISFFD